MNPGCRGGGEASAKILGTLDEAIVTARAQPLAHEKSPRSFREIDVPAVLTIHLHPISRCPIRHPSIIEEVTGGKGCESRFPQSTAFTVGEVVGTPTHHHISYFILPQLKTAPPL